MSKELEAVEELRRLNKFAIEHNSTFVGEALYQIIEKEIKKVDKLRAEIKLNSFVFYDEIADRDRMCYQIIFKNGYKESISMGLYHVLKGVLSDE